MAIPEHTLAALNRYVEHRLMPGGFLTRVLCNDLFGAVAHADSENRAALADICQYIYNRIPGDAWGSQETVWKWLENKFYDRINETSTEN